MKLKATLLFTVLTMFAASTTIAYADHHVEAKSEASKEKKADAKKSVKKHNHAEEKSGMTMPDAASGVVGHESMKKMNGHDHTKDRH